MSTSSTPSVSVLLPVRDGAAHLEAAAASLSSQTLEDVEVIAVDDGSTDASPELLDAWAARDPRVRVLRQPPGGIVAALERARAVARGRYLARMDADDIAEPTRLERQLLYLEANPGLAGCGCLVRYFPRAVVRGGARRYEAWINGVRTPEDIARGRFVECPLAHPTFFLRTEAVERAGGYVNRGWPEDYDLVLRLLSAGERLGKVDEVLLRWREGESRLSRTHERYTPEAFLACKVHYLRRDLLGGDRDRRAGERPDAGRKVVVWGAGPVGKAVARALAGEGVGVRAFVELDPRKIGQEIHGAPVVDTEEGLTISGALHLAAVGQAGARERITELLEGAGMHALDDFVAIA